MLVFVHESWWNSLVVCRSGLSSKTLREVEVRIRREVQSVVICEEKDGDVQTYDPRTGTNKGSTKEITRCHSNPKTNSLKSVNTERQKNIDSFPAVGTASCLGRGKR